MTGLEFLEALQQRGLSEVSRGTSHWSTTGRAALWGQIILMTGFDSADIAIEATKFGAFDYVIQPNDFPSLFRKLQPLIAEALEIARPVPEVYFAADTPPWSVSGGSPPSGSAAGPMLVGKSEPMQ